MLGPLIMITHQLTVADLDGEHQNLTFFYLLSSLPPFWGRQGLFLWVSVLKYLLLDLFSVSLIWRILSSL